MPGPRKVVSMVAAHRSGKAIGVVHAPNATKNSARAATEAAVLP